MVALLALTLLVLAYQATRTALALRQVKSDAAVLSQQVRRGDAAAVQETLRHLTSQARTAHDHSDNVLWSVAVHTPWIGGDIRAVRVVSASLDSTARRALPTALSLYDTLKQQRLRTDDGRFDTTAIGSLTPRFRQLGTDLAPAAQGLRELDADRLRVPLVAGATRELQQQMSSLVTLADAGARATQLMPTMLGAQGPRTYLLVVQNNAEVRATGGLPGSLLVIRARNGKISLGERYSAIDYPRSTTPVLPLTAQERELYGTGIALDVREANEVPDWPRAAQLFSAFEQRAHGRRLDGVLATDPIALSALLRATGPIQVGGETFTSSDVVRKLLNTVYLRYDDPLVQDAYFASAAKGIFDRLSSRPVDQVAAVRAFGTTGSERRLRVWSRHRDEQRVLEGTTVAGALPTGEKAATDVGMYLNDGTAAKMQYYLDYVGGIRALTCNADDGQTFESRLRLRSTAPADAASLPVYVTGSGRFAPKGSQRVFLRVYGPAGGTITRLVTNGQEQKDVHVFTQQGRPVVYLNLLIKAQGTIDVVTTMRTSPDQTGRLRAEWTPGVRAGATSVVAGSGCA